MTRWLATRSRNPVSLFDSWTCNMERMMDHMMSTFEPLSFRPVTELQEKELTIKPRGDFYREDDRIIMEFEIPGLTPEKMDLKIFKDHIDISAVKEQEKKMENERYIRSERYYGKIQRAIAFPGEVDPESAKASYDKGILRIEVREIGRILDNGKKIAIEHSEAN